MFDADTQRTLEEVDSINLLPAHEFPTDKTAIELFRSQWRDRFDVKRDAEHIYQQVSKGTLPAGIEYWQPLFFNEPLPALFSYFPANTLIVNTGDIDASASRFESETRARFENRGVDPMRPLLPPEMLWLRTDELNAELKRWPRMQLKTDSLADKAANTNLAFRMLPDRPFRRSRNPRSIICASFLSPSPGRWSSPLKVKVAVKRWANCWEGSKSRQSVFFA